MILVKKTTATVKPEARRGVPTSPPDENTFSEDHKTQDLWFLPQYRYMLITALLSSAISGIPQQTLFKHFKHAVTMGLMMSRIKAFKQQ